jgi:hypothetical protein
VDKVEAGAGLELRQKEPRRQFGLLRPLGAELQARSKKMRAAGASGHGARGRGGLIRAPLGGMPNVGSAPGRWRRHSLRRPKCPWPPVPAITARRKRRWRRAAHAKYGREAERGGRRRAHRQDGSAGNDCTRIRPRPLPTTLTTHCDAPLTHRLTRSRSKMRDGAVRGAFVEPHRKLGGASCARRAVNRAERALLSGARPRVSWYPVAKDERVVPTLRRARLLCATLDILA